MRQVSPGQAAPGGSGGEREFFIPDLCAPRPVFVMVLLVELMVIVYTLVAGGLPRFDWNLLATGSLFVQWVVLLSAALLCLIRAPLSRVSLPLAAGGSLLLVLAVTALSSHLALAFYPQFAPGGGFWWLLRNLLVAGVVGGVVLRNFYLQQQLRQQEQLELQARLDSLQSRIRPHFLFNTMNSIASLIASHPEAAEQAVVDLSELLRASLRRRRQPGTVADELRLCEIYLGIEKLRLGGRLQVRWQVDEAALEQPMPSLLLQPLVENAVYHGIARLPEGGAICVVVRLAEGQLSVAVENPVPAHAGPGEGHQLAMANIGQRLQASYGAGASMRVTPGDDRFRVELSYPPGLAL